MSSKTMMWELCGPVFVIVHSTENPSDAEYTQTLDGYQQHLGAFNGILICTDGGAPNLKQRKATTEFWKGKDLPRTAIMTSSKVTRGVITALSWVLPAQKINAVEFNDYAGAFSYLEVPEQWHTQIKQTVGRLRRELEAERLQGAVGSA